MNKTIKELISNITAEQVEAFKISIDENTDIDGINVIWIFKNYYSCYRIINASTFEEFFLMWEMFLKIYAKSINNIYTALTSEYGVLDNYNGHEEHEIVNDTTVKSGSETNEASVNNNNTFTAGRATTSLVNDYADATLRENFKTQDSGTDESETITESIGATTYNDVTNSRTFKEITDRRGNLGVTTSQQMINEELKLRVQNEFVQKIVAMFLFNVGY